MMTDSTSLPDDYDLGEYDAVLLDHDDLDEFMAAHSDCDDLFISTDVYTEDDHTKNTVEFNLIMGGRNDAGDYDYGVATQIHDPFEPGEDVLDLRDETGSFADWAMGTA